MCVCERERERGERVLMNVCYCFQVCAFGTAANAGAAAAPEGYKVSAGPAKHLSDAYSACADQGGRLAKYNVASDKAIVDQVIAVGDAPK